MGQIYVSYAWKDRDEDGENNREVIVDQLCEAFKERGYYIVRDKKDMQYRDLIRNFMSDIASATAL